MPEIKFLPAHDYSKGFKLGVYSSWHKRWQQQKWSVRFLAVAHLYLLVNMVVVLHGRGALLREEAGGFFFRVTNLL